jgi:protoporphyrinogen oxidase
MLNRPNAVRSQTFEHEILANFPTPGTAMKINEIDHSIWRATDQKRCAPFYEEALKQSRNTSSTAMQPPMSSTRPWAFFQLIGLSRNT